jgi:3-hydroxybutyryl-CoA dehydrogenase
MFEDIGISTVGVVGAGVMGTGVAQCCAQAGFRVLLSDIWPEALEQARETIRTNLRFAGMLGGTAVRAEDTPESVMERVVFSDSLGQFDDAEFVIENVTEKWQVKQAVFAALDRTCPPHCILSSNTSVIPINMIASATERPGLVIGTHFMNPAPMKPVVEVVRGAKTAEATIDKTRLFLAQMGKDCIVVNDGPGFAINRVLMQTINQAICLVEDGIAKPAEIDELFRKCVGHKMGPLETADLIGLDTVLLSIEALTENLGEPRFKPCRLLVEMVRDGKDGRKTGQGFYEY